MVGLHSCAVPHVSLIQQLCAKKRPDALIFLHGLTSWLGHLGHSFRCAAVGFRLEIQGDECPSLWPTPEALRSVLRKRSSGRYGQARYRGVTQWIKVARYKQLDDDVQAV